tara:strand:+ start:3919 stop:4119 length:201 start_codon:yes stop_codon:yes gene_type:complete
MIPIQGHKNLYRDEITGAVINKDDYGYAQYMKMKSKKDSQKEELDRMRDDIDEIKSLLKELVSKSL